MNCDELEDCLVDGGPLSEDATAHLVACADCRARKERFEQAASRLRSMVAERSKPLSPELRERVVASAASPPPTFRIHRGGLLAFALVAAGIGFVVFKPTVPPPEKQGLPRDAQARVPERPVDAERHDLDRVETDREISLKTQRGAQQVESHHESVDTRWRDQTAAVGSQSGPATIATVTSANVLDALARVDSKTNAALDDLVVNGDMSKQERVQLAMNYMNAVNGNNGVAAIGSDEQAKCLQQINDEIVSRRRIGNMKRAAAEADAERDEKKATRMMAK
jgi:hypothetical protein